MEGGRVVEWVVDGAGKDYTVHVARSLPLQPPRPANLLWHGDVEALLDALPGEPIFDLVVTLPPYNIGKEYEARDSLEDYFAWQARIIKKIHPLVTDAGSICCASILDQSTRTRKTRTCAYG